MDFIQPAASYSSSAPSGRWEGNRPLRLAELDAWSPAVEQPPLAPPAPQHPQQLRHHGGPRPQPVHNVPRGEPVPVQVMVRRASADRGGCGGAGGCAAGFPSCDTVPGSGYSNAPASDVTASMTLPPREQCGTFEGGYDGDGGRVPQHEAAPNTLASSIGHRLGSADGTPSGNIRTRSRSGERSAAAAAAAAYAAVAEGTAPPPAPPPVGPPMPVAAQLPRPIAVEARGPLPAPTPMPAPGVVVVNGKSAAAAPLPAVPVLAKPMEWPTLTGALLAAPRLQEDTLTGPHPSLETTTQVFSSVTAVGIPQSVPPQSRCPADTGEVFAVGAIVEYNSPSQGKWIPARVLVRHADGRYDLDCKPGVLPSRMRPISQMVASAIAAQGQGLPPAAAGGPGSCAVAPGAALPLAAAGTSQQAKAPAHAVAAATSMVTVAAAAPTSDAGAPPRPCLEQSPNALALSPSRGGPPAPPRQPMPPCCFSLNPPSPAGGPYSSLRVLVGKLEFQGTGSIGSMPGIFDSVTFRIHLQFGGMRTTDMAALASPELVRFRPKWIDGGPVTEPQRPKYGRHVSTDGRYSAKIYCDFDEGIDLPWPGAAADVSSVSRAGPSQLMPGHISADVWIERRTAVERIDTILSKIGLGGDLPEYDHVWLGRAVASLPAEGNDTVPFPWPVEADEKAASEGPVPRAIALGIEWVSAADADEDSAEDRKLFGHGPVL